MSAYLVSRARRYRRPPGSRAAANRAGIGVILLELAIVTASIVKMAGGSKSGSRRLARQTQEREARNTEFESQAERLEEQAVQIEQQSDDALRSSERLAVSKRDLASSAAMLRIAHSTGAIERAAGEQTQSLLDFVLESSPVGFAMFDLDGRFTLANEAMATLAGTPTAELIGKCPRDLLPAEGATDVEEILNLVASTGVPVLNVPLRSSLTSEPLSERAWLVSYFPVGLKKGPLLGVGIVATETTERLRLEEQLLQSRKLEAVGRLAGGVAHDFNNMLTAIKSYSDLLLDDLEPESREHADAEEINKAVDRAAALTRQLLAFSRQQVLRPQVMDLNATISAISGMLQTLAGATVRFHVSLDPDLASVVADPAELERVIVNLVLNARDAMPEGGSLSIRTANYQLDDTCLMEHTGTLLRECVMLVVSDTGHGMTKDVRERMFEPFFTTKERSKGTGLGLASAYGVVNQLNGHIWVYSEPGRGTTFKICLPRAAADTAAATDGHADGEAANPVVTDSRKGETILLVEDDDAVRTVAARILSRAGYNVIGASNGIEALAICDENGFDLDLIITDIVMPEMNGAELSSRIREVRPGARILFTSGYTEDSALRQQILKPGAAFLEKPFTVAGLVGKAREVLDSAPSTGSPAPVVPGEGLQRARRILPQH